MKYRYFTCDVFTDVRFGGNQLAVLPAATGLSDSQMQQIAREFNYSETTFVFPSESNTRVVRIFTPVREVPFAGHPNVGTAFVLAATKELGDVKDSTTVTFEEKAGIVPIRISLRDGSISCELSAPQRLSIGKSLSREDAASALSLQPDEIVTARHQPQEASVGLPFVMVEVRDREALTHAQASLDSLMKLASAGISPDIHVYLRSSDDFDIRARMFAPMDGVREDPATGSANCALAGLLAQLEDKAEGTFSWRIAQGVEMGRPSLLHARAVKEADNVTSTFIGGTSVMVSEGYIEV